MEGGNLSLAEILEHIKEHFDPRFETEKQLLNADPDILIAVMYGLLEKSELVQRTSYFQKLEASGSIPNSFMQKLFVVKEAMHLLKVNMSLGNFLPVDSKQMRVILSAIIKFHQRFLYLISIAEKHSSDFPNLLEEKRKVIQMVQTAEEKLKALREEKEYEKEKRK